MRRIGAWRWLLVALGAACDAAGGGGRLVPLTVVDDPQLPRVEVRVGTHTRLLHVREFGDRGLPTLVMLHGSASDLRAYWPLAEHLAATRHVVLYDLPGNGLSERVPRDELGFEAQAQALEALRVALGLDSPFALLGYSWSSPIVARYLAAHPDRVERAILLESPGLTGEWQNEAGSALNLLAPGYLALVGGNEFVTPIDHERADWQVLGMLFSGVRAFSCPGVPATPLPVWRPGALALAEWETSTIGAGGKFEYDFTPGLDAFERPVLLVGTSCSPIGYAFQERTNATAFRHVRVARIEDSGHRMIVEKPAEVLAALDAFLAEAVP